MSGICGLFNLDSAPAARSELEAMTAMLARRGPDETRLWHNGPIGLGHTLLATTPELLFESQPYIHPQTGCAITADVRLDNRSELFAALNLSDRQLSMGDAELILQGYLAWGEHCLDRLLGDFAFAIWDPRHQKLICARDHFGMRPFYYFHAPGKIFAFSSDARALLVLPQVPHRINEGRIADFLVSELEWIDYTSTFFRDVYRLPPGHKLTVNSSRLELVEYWKPQPGPELGERSYDDYAQGFLEVFSKAVDARLRAPPGAVGSMLSGGMDSGTVVVVAKDMLRARGDGPLPTFSGVRPRDPESVECKESNAIYAAAAMPAISATLLHPDDLQQHFETLVAGSEEPFDGEMMLLKFIYCMAHEAGLKVLLDGGAGDVVLGEGSYVVRLLRRGKFKSALAEIRGESRFWDDSPVVPEIIRYTRAAMVPDFARQIWRTFHGRKSMQRSVNESLLSRTMAARVQIEQRFQQLRDTFPGRWTPDYAVERSIAIRPNITAGRERYARAAAASATEARDPFLDKRVVDYCSRLPGELRMNQGWPKIILRELTAGRLPDEVRWSRGKHHLGWVFNGAVTRLACQQGKLDIDKLRAVLGDYVDSPALDSAWERFVAGEDAQPIHTAYLLSLWLQENSNRPVVPN